MKTALCFPISSSTRACLLDVKHGVTIVPSAAVQRGAKGTFVYVVKEDRTVAVRPVAVGASHGDDASISSGLSPEELVVVDGTEKLREGSRVEVRNQGDRPANDTDASPTGVDTPQPGRRS